MIDTCELTPPSRQLLDYQQYQQYPKKNETLLADLEELLVQPADFLVGSFARLA